MSDTPVIDLSQLPAPRVVESLDFESVLQQRTEQFLSLLPDDLREQIKATLELESEPLAIALQESAYRELALRHRINEAARSVMLAYAEGADLDHLAAHLGVGRLVVAPADPSTRPPTPAVYESDADLRRRAQLAIEATTVAGSRQAYVFHTLGAHPAVADAYIDPDAAAGEVRVVVLSRNGDGSADDDIIQSVFAALSAEDVRPLNDTVIVESASIVSFEISATLHIGEGPSASEVVAVAEAKLSSYLREMRGIGRSIPLSGIYAALHQPGVIRVDIHEPAADVRCRADEAAHCTAVALSKGGGSW